VWQKVALAFAVVMIAFAGIAQQGSGFVGQWQGTVDGVGGAKMVITNVGADGRIEGRMEFDLQSHVSTFADKADTTRSTNRGTVSGSTLTIETALGGTYRLSLSGDRLAGTYTRGTTFSGSASFKRL
jgi:hypothetical protein